MSTEGENLRKRIDALEEELDALKSVLGNFSVGSDKVSQIQASQTAAIEGLVRANEAQAHYLERLVENSKQNIRLMNLLLTGKEGHDGKIAKLVFEKDMPLEQLQSSIFSYLSIVLELQYAIDDLISQTHKPIEAQIEGGQVIKIDVSVASSSHENYSSNSQEVNNDFEWGVSNG